MTQRSLLVLSVVILAACSSSDGDGSGAGTDGTDGTAATDGTDGTDGQGTDGTDGQGTDGTDATGPVFETCESADDCEATEVCDCLGRCVPKGLDGLSGCTEDKNCGSENYCDACAAECRPIKTLCEPCVEDNECEDGAACLDFASGGRFCLRACVANPGCPQPGFSCEQITGVTQKQCIPLSGKCATPSECQDDAACEFGSICTQGTCSPGCPDDDACPNGQVCTKFRCVEACDDATNPCPGEQICDEGHCKIEGGCLEPADCEAPETFCDPADNMCKPGCLQDFDCKASGKECQNNACVDKGCTANFFCAFEQVCNLDSGKCEQAVGPYCEEGCDPQSDAACGGAPNKCLSLQDKDGNALGDFCFVACGPDPANPCPQGYACQELQDQDGNPTGDKLCFRDCTTKPVGVE